MEYRKKAFAATIFALILAIRGGVFSQEYHIVRSGNYDDFLAGLRANIQIISPDPDGTDNGCIAVSDEDTIKVLLVYPPGHNFRVVGEAVYRYQHDGNPLLNFAIDCIDITSFNNTGSIDDTITVFSTIDNREHRQVIRNYDILFFGVADSYGGRDLSSNGVRLVRSFVALGKGIILTHDTIANGREYHPNFNSLSDITGIRTNLQLIWDIFDRVQRTSAPSTDPVLHRPFELPTSFDVLDCHAQGQVSSSGYVWYEGRGILGNQIYMHTYFNPEYNSYSAFFNYGHTEQVPQEWEAKAMINCMYYAHFGGQTEGVFISAVISFPCIVSLTNANWSVDIPADGSCEISIRRSTDGVNFGDWQIISQGEIPAELRLCSALQYRVRLIRGNSLISPIFHYIEFGYTVDRPRATIIYPPEPNMISSCRCQEVKFVIQSEARILTETAQLVVNGELADPADFELRGDTLIFTPSEPCFRNGELVRVSLLNITNSNGCDIQETLSTNFLIDITPPIVIDLAPAPGSIVSGENLIIRAIIYDSLTRISQQTLRININGEWIRFPSPGLSIIGDTLNFIPSYLGIEPESNVTVCIDSLGDIATLCGPNRITPHCWSFFVDRTPPTIRLLEPQAYSSCETLYAIFSIRDTSGINFETIRFSFNGEELIYPDNITIIDTILIVHSDQRVESGELVRILLLFSEDNLGNRSDTTSFAYIADRTPPQIGIISPNHHDVLNTSTPIIRALVYDELSGIDTSSIRFVVNGTDTIAFSSPCIYFVSETLFFNMGACEYRFENGESVTVELIASDLSSLCGPNTNPPEGVTFTIDLGGPSVRLLSPERGSYISCDSLEILINVYDPSGIDTTSIEFEFDGNLYMIGSSRLNMRNDSLIFQTPLLENGREYRFRLISADDILGNHINPQPIWYFTVDRTPPSITPLFPPPVTSDSFPIIVISIADSGAGIDFDSIIITINNDTITENSPCVELDSLSGRIIVNTRECDINLTEGTNIITIRAADKAELCGQNWQRHTWTVEADFSPPLLTLVTPENGSFVSCETLTIIINVSDPNEFLPSSITIAINEDTLASTDERMEFNGNNIIISPNFWFAEYETAFISIISASDTLGNSVSHTQNQYFIVDRVPPTVEPTYPLPNQTITELQPTIRMMINDTGAGVDLSGIILTINGAQYTGENEAFTWTPPLLEFNPANIGLFFPEEESVRVSIRVADRAALCGPNILENFRWSFYIADDDTVAPIFISYEPQAFMEDSAFYVEIKAIESSGIYTGAINEYNPYIRFNVNSPPDTDSRVVPLQVVRTVNDTITLQTIVPLGGFTGNDTIFLFAYASDNDMDLDNINDISSATSQIFKIFIRRRPRARILYPPDGYHTACETESLVFLVESEYGIKRESVRIRINEHIYTGTDEHIIITNDTITLNIPFELEEGINRFSFLYVTDTLDQPLLNEVSSSIYADHYPPVLYNLSPRNWEMVPDVNIIISGTLTDPSGVRENALTIIIGNGQAFDTIRSNEPSMRIEHISETEIRFVARPRFLPDDGDTIWVKLIYADNVSGCPSNVDSSSFSFWIEPELSCSLSTNPFTPNNDGINDIVSFFYPKLYSKPGKIEIYRIDGEKVRTITVEPGSIWGSFWDGKDKNGNDCQNGTYIYIISTNDRIICKGTITLAR